jgi:hypothetical protein
MVRKLRTGPAKAIVQGNLGFAPSFLLHLAIRPVFQNRRKDMRTSALIAGVLALGIMPAIAQTSTTSPMPAPRPGVDNMAPLPGANSFTEAQVRERLEAGGFTAPTGLRKDDQGIWRGMAMRSGASTPVAIDYRGNIFQK